MQTRLDLANWPDKLRDLATSGEFLIDMEGEKENNTVEVYERRVEEVYGHSDTDLPGERIFLGEGDLMEIWNETRSADDIDSKKEMQELIAKTAANEAAL